MEKATNGQFREFIGKLLVKGSDEVVAQIDKTKIQNAVNSLNSLSDEDGVFHNFVSFINNGCRLNTILVNGFTVGDVFRHRAEKGDRRLYLGDNFQNLVVKPNFKKIIPIRTDIGKLNEYCLPNNMNDTSIQSNAGNPGLMELEVFLCVIYLLIFQPKLGKQILGYSLQKDKWYVFHAIVDGEKVAFSMYWSDGEWDLSACKFDTNDWWFQAYVFLFPATKAVAEA